jgi:carboxylesterase type B
LIGIVAALGAPAYLYLFSYVGETFRAQASGAGHGAEAPYVFDSLDRMRQAQLDVQEAAASPGK